MERRHAEVKNKVRNILILLAIVVGSDQISKYIIRRNIDYNHQINVIDNFITLTKAENTGAFLSLGDNLPRAAYTVLMIIIPLIALLIALNYLFRNTSLSKILIIGLCLIIGGGLGNIIDRIIYGSVTDFLYFNFGVFHTGIVNLADIALTTGCFILIYELSVRQWITKLKS